MNWKVIGGAALLLFCAQAAHAQTATDSIPVWTEVVRSGSLADKADATARLASLPRESLPAATMQVLVAEIQRLDQLMKAGSVPDAASLGEDGFGEYFLDLVTTVADFPGVDVSRVLVAAIDAGVNFQERVAEAGDAVIPDLVAIVSARGDARGAALETLGMAWYWADSTNAPLSTASRTLIVRTLVDAAGGTDYRLRRTAVEAFGLSGDAAFLPAAEAMLQAAEARDEPAIMNALSKEVIPALRAKAQAQTPKQQLEGALRSFDLLCADARGARNGACTSLRNEFETAARHIDAARAQPARNVLDAIAKRADQERDRGVFSSYEHALIAGNARSLISRL